MNDFWQGIVTIILGFISLATLSALFSKNANTAGIISAGSAAVANDILAAVSPISGANGSINTSSSAYF